MQTDDSLVKFLSRHLVSLVFTFQKDGERSRDCLTGFILSVSNHWFLITAGHVIRELRNRTDSEGYVLVACDLIDYLGVGARNEDSIPFRSMWPKMFALSVINPNLDYGFKDLSLYYIEMLKSNGIVPLNEEVWRNPPNQADFYHLLGIPGEVMNFGFEDVQIRPLLYPVERLNEKPSGFSETDFPLFYGRINLGDELSSIKGTSGGLIFPLLRNGQGQQKYWLVALQSKWLPDSHLIAACPINWLGEFLEHAVARLKYEQAKMSVDSA